MSAVDFQIAIIADLDLKSKVGDENKTFKSYLKYGKLVKDNDGNYSVTFNQDHVEMTSNESSAKGRGMELSELCWFNGKLYAPADVTGIIYEIKGNKVFPWVTLYEGNGESTRGFKGEWMTPKGDVVYVGSHGVNARDRKWVKTITKEGVITHCNWTANFDAVHNKLGIPSTGYATHEAVEWSEHKQKWFFLPRKVANVPFDEKLDERCCTNVLVSASADFTEMNVVHVGDLEKTRGFSSMKFVPGTNDNVAIALKSTEMQASEETNMKDVAKTYVTMFDVETGTVILPDQFIADYKFEGIVFMNSE